MLRLLLVGLIVSCGGFSVRAADEAELPRGELVKADELPEGYEASEKKLEVDGSVAYILAVQNPEQNSKVVVMIETRKLSDVDSRRAATKGYINGNASVLEKAGLKVLERVVPDLDKETFTRPVVVTALFESEDGRKFRLHQEIFFTDKGFAVTVLADDDRQFSLLKRWARTIRPTPAAK